MAKKNIKKIFEAFGGGLDSEAWRELEAFGGGLDSEAWRELEENANSEWTNRNKSYVLRSKTQCARCNCFFRPLQNESCNLCHNCGLEQVRAAKLKSATCHMCKKKIKGISGSTHNFVCTECQRKKRCPVCKKNLILQEHHVCTECSDKIITEQGLVPKSKKSKQKIKPKVGERKVKFDGPRA